MIRNEVNILKEIFIYNVTFSLYLDSGVLCTNVDNIKVSRKVSFNTEKTNKYFTERREIESSDQGRTAMRHESEHRKFSTFTRFLKALNLQLSTMF